MSTCAFLLLLFSLRHPSAVDLSFYFGDAVTFNQNIPTPADVLGFEIGTRHLRHDQLVRYLERLDAASDRVSLSVIGETHEGRPLLHLTITAPGNHARLEALRTRHLELSAGKGDPEQGPVVVWMGYSVHGNEPSGTNAAPLVAYYLAAANGLDEVLADTVIVFDRIRETLARDRAAPLPGVIDRAITETLRRTLMTSGTTLMASVTLMALGGPVLFGFAAAVTVGVALGTLSSIFVAAPLLLHLPGALIAPLAEPRA